MSDPKQNWLTTCKKFFVAKKSPCGVPFITPHGFVFLSVRAVAFGESNRAETTHRPRNECHYRPNRPSLNFCSSCLPTFAGKVTFGSVCATSAADLPTLAFTGVARKGWVSPACGPLSTVAMPGKVVPCRARGRSRATFPCAYGATDANLSLRATFPCAYGLPRFLQSAVQTETAQEESKNRLWKRWEAEVIPEAHPVAMCG